MLRRILSKSMFIVKYSNVSGSIIWFLFLNSKAYRMSCILFFFKTTTVWFWYWLMEDYRFSMVFATRIFKGGSRKGRIKKDRPTFDDFPRMWGQRAAWNIYRKKKGEKRDIGARWKEYISDRFNLSTRR